SQPEQEIKTPPGTFRSRSFTRLTIRVGLPHLGQSVLFDVSITFLRSAVFAIFAISSPNRVLPQAQAWALIRNLGVTYKAAHCSRWDESRRCAHQRPRKARHGRTRLSNFT